MKFYQSIIIATLAALSPVCGTGQSLHESVTTSAKLTKGDIMRAPERSKKLVPREHNSGAAKQKKTAIRSAASASSTQPTLYAAMINRSTWGSTMEYGIYSFMPGEYSFELVKKDYNLNANGGASYIGDNNYVAINSTDFGGFMWVEIHAYDTTSWGEVYSTMGDESVIATDMTYCAVDNKVYGCFNNDSGNGYVFGIFDQDSFERTVIGSLKEAWIACGAAADGTVYAVTVSGDLVTADRQTGAVTVVGNTGLKSDHLTSGTIDTSTGKFYVATCNEDGSALYEVNTADATAELLYDMPDGEELVGMYVARQALNPAAPASVTDLKAEFEENSLSGTVSFVLPSTTLGGTQGSGVLNYTISAGEQTLASGTGSYGQKVSADVTFEAAGTYDVTVYASNSAAAGPASVVSVTVTGGVSEEDLLELPYTETFSTQADFDKFTVIDVQKDGWTWVYWANRGCALCQFSPTNDSDDYFVMKPVLLEKDKIYILTCDLSRRGAPYQEAYEFVMGKLPSPESLSTILRSKQVITDDNVHKEVITITPAETGVKYIAIHCISPADAYGLCVDNLTLSTGAEATAPQTPVISVKPDYNGAKEALVTVTVPKTDMTGRELSNVASLTVVRDSKAVKTFENPKPGETLTYTDQVSTDGYYTYGAYAANESGNGHMSYEKVYVGINYPAPPTNVTIKESPNSPGTVTMKWDAPTTDADGNPMNPELVSYMIAHRMNGANLSIVKRGVKGTEYTFQALDPEKDAQKFVTYLIFSETASGVNDMVITQTTPIAVGRPFDMPYAETFGGADISPLLATSSKQSATWEITDEVSDQDGDGKYMVYNGISGAIGSLTTAKIAITETSPVFSFWYMCIENAQEEVIVSVDSGNGYTDVATVCIGEGDPYIWTKATVPMSDYIGKTVQIKLTYTTREYRLAIDNIRVEMPGIQNLSVRGISVPYFVNPGVPFEVRLYVTNNGISNPGKFTADLYREGVKVTTTEAAGLEPFQSTTMTFKDTVHAMTNTPASYFAVVNCPEDIDESDNITGAVTVDIEHLDYPIPPSLKAEGNGNMVWLSWKDVEISRENIHMVDDLESLTAFSTGLENSELTNDNIGHWTTVNADGGRCYVMQVSGSYLRFPNANSETGFMVFDPELAGVPTKVLNQWAAHDGSKQYFLAMATIGMQNDKWLISPLLSGEAQTISFYAKSAIDDYGLESFEVLYSTTGKELTDFIKAGEVSASVPLDWTQYSYDLPEGAKYFAIRSTSNDVYALLVDDIEFEKAHPHRSLELQGYRVYRDAVPVNTEPIANTEHYISEYPDGQSHIYNVTALYATGESAPSNDASLTTGIDDMVGVEPMIESGAGYIGIRNAAGRNVSVCRIDGVTYFSGQIDEDVRISLLPGIYIVEISGKATKVIVK